MRVIFADKYLRSGRGASFWARHNIPKIIKFAALAVPSILLMSCSESVAKVDDLCEVRIYQQQTLMAFSDNSSKARNTPSTSEDSNFIQRNISPDLWVIQDYVRVKKWGKISEPKTTNFKKISLDTTFLIVGVDDPLSFKFTGEKYFDGAYSDITMDEACPIFTGRRNGKFALATLRTFSGGETPVQANRCDIYATLVYFGISKDDLSHYSDFVETQRVGDLVFGRTYNPYAIRAYLESKKSCSDGAYENLRLAAEAGDAEAQFNLGGLYISVLGGVVPSDEARAKKWFRLSAEQGNAEAQTELGALYSWGSNKDEVEALKWYRLAAKQGDRLAQFNLGQIHAEGRGVKQNYVQGYLWISIAEADQDFRITNVKKSLAALMTQKQIAQAQSLASKCVDSNYQECE